MAYVTETPRAAAGLPLGWISELVEGYKTGNRPKIEIIRSARHSEPLLENDEFLIAVVTDVDLQLKVPRFGFEDVVPLADMIEEKFL